MLPRCSSRLFLILVTVCLGGCGPKRPVVERRSETAAATAGQTVNPGRESSSNVVVTGEPIGAVWTGKPWIAHVLTCDLDRDGADDLLVCEARENRITWIHRDADGAWHEPAIAEDVPAPVHTDVVDWDGDGDSDILVACMGEVFPNNDRIGSVLLLRNDGAQRFTREVLAEKVARVTDVRAADLNGDGRLDLAVAHFGYDQGEINWLEQRADGSLTRHVLLNLSGAINVEVADLNGDRQPDIVAVVAQQWEEVYLFENQGHGEFGHKVIFASTNEDFGSSGIRLVDLNQDGRLDVLYSNGDGFDYAEPGARPWHGVQWLENLGDAAFRFHRIGDLPGAYSPVAIDLNGDGALDVVACSGFNAWAQPGAVSLRAFMNDGRQHFRPVDLATVPTHLMCMTTARLDGPQAPPALVTGGFHAYPPWNHLSRVTAWRIASKSTLSGDR